jgi:serine phosphatase RsbU (regulator of sigma subunit)
MFSDGITDQFSHNGEHKFGYKRIQKIFVDHASQPMDSVHLQFEEQMDSWMGDHRQMDDMLLMGIKL